MMSNTFLQQLLTLLMLVNKKNHVHSTLTNINKHNF